MHDADAYATLLADRRRRYLNDAAQQRLLTASTEPRIRATGGILRSMQSLVFAVRTLDRQPDAGSRVPTPRVL
jgi:hypothetical protein